MPRPVRKPLGKPRRRPSTEKLRQRLRRHSSRESINAHRANSPPIPVMQPQPIPMPDLFPPEPEDIDHDTEPYHSELETIPELNLTHIWEQVMRARSPLDLGDQELRSEGSRSHSTHTSKTPLDSLELGGSDSDESADVDNVEYNPATYGLPPESFIREQLLVKVAKLARTTIGPDDLDTIRDFNFFVREKTAVRTHEAMRRTYCRSETKTKIPSLKSIRTRMLALSALKPVKYHCCKNSCVCYAGYLANLNDCPYCHSPRLDPSGRPYSIFQHIPLIPQLRALFRNRATFLKMLYRSEFQRSGTHVRDVFDAVLYELLCATRVVVDGVEQPYRHFEDFRELALAIALDGMGPFKRRNHSCWPILIIIYNFPPEIRTHLSNMICTGVIPGPHSPKDLNSFLQPLIDELVELSRGVEAVDVVNAEVFALRAHILAAFGDLPAIAKLMEFVGHNGRFPCRLCKIMSILGRTAKNASHLYCPLHRSDDTGLDPYELPLRTHEECLKDGYDVLRAPNDTARADLATDCGIKGVTLLAKLSSIRIPDSFPVEAMHLVWINLIPQLADLWREKFNGIDSGFEDYLINALVWNSMGDMCVDSSRSTPSSFGCPIPHFRNRSHFTAESWSRWATHAAPNLLRRRFMDSRYYIHFVRLVNLMNKCTDHAVDRSELPAIRRGFIEWVEDFEQIYYQHDPERIQVCTTNIHYLLHIVDSIERLGPLPGYWAFPMERYCSFIGASVKSRRFPYANIARRVCDVAQLCIIREIYDLRNMISFGQTRASTEEDLKTEMREGDKFENYPNRIFLTPRAEALTVTPELRAQISKYLATTYEVRIGKKLALELIPDTLQQWGRMRITQGGDLIQARGYHKLRWDGRDASFVRYELLADRLAHLPRATPDFVPTSYYGQLQYLFKLPLKPESVVNPSKDGSKYLILAFILEAPVVIEDAYEYRVTWYEGKLGSGEVVDALTIQCAIGRIQDNKLYTCYALDEQSPGNPTLIHASDPSAQIRTPQISPTPDEECKSDPRPRIRPLRKCPTPNKPKNPTPEQKSDPSRNSDPWRLQTSDPREKVRPSRGFRFKKPNPSRNNPPAPGSGDAGPSALDWVLMGDTGLLTSAPETLARVASAPLPSKPRSHWAVTVLQAEEEFDKGPVWAWEQFELPQTAEVDGLAYATITKAGLYRAHVTRAALTAVLAALERIEAASVQRAAHDLNAETASQTPDLPSNPTSHAVDETNPSIEPLNPKFPVDLSPPDEAKFSVTLKAPFLGNETHSRPLLRPAERAQACDPRIHSAVTCAVAIRAGDSQPGVLVRWLDPRDSPTVQGKNVFVYNAWVEENRLPIWCDEVPVGKIAATRDGAVLVKTADHGRLGGCGLWITHVRVPLAKGVSGGLNPKLPAVDGLRSAGLGAAVQNAREWNICGKVVLEQDRRNSEPGVKVELGWEKRPGTWQQTWVEFEELRDGGKAAYVYFDYYNGAFMTYQCEQLLRALRWATHPDRGDLKFLVLMGGSYFSNGIALNTVEGSEDPSLEGWKNINAINDVVELVISDSSEPAKRLAQNSKVADAFKPLFGGASLAERGIVTIASVRSNVAAGGFAVATAADIVLCSESAVINPHYRGVGLYGSEFHTYSFYERAGEEKARELLRTMLPMSAVEACKLGLVDEVMKGGDADCYVGQTKAYVRQLAGERADAISKYRSAPWTRPASEEVSVVSLTDLLISNKLATHAKFTRPLVSYRHAELSQMLLDFYHQTRSKRFSERRRAFVRKIAPKTTPLRFATHRRENGKLDEEETDDFDAAEGWVAGAGVEWSWVGLPPPPTSEAWEEVYPEISSSESNQEHHTPELSAANSTASLAEPMTKAEPQTPTETAMKPMSESVHAKLSPVNLGTKLIPAKLLSDKEGSMVHIKMGVVPEQLVSASKSTSTRSRLFVPVRSIRRKSDAGIQRSPADGSLAPPSPTGSSNSGLRRSRSSVEVGSGGSEQDQSGRNRSTNRISRWFGSTFKSVKSPTAPRMMLPKTPEGTATADKEGVLFPCYYDNNKTD
ncbi:Transposase family tnp2 [Rhizoctonia solani]|uniref:Transposase family tnp2 n=1 Tax=Rhizoctonia solani TaxID=456999 RepID=A0A8H7H546_9AGAM|nr:Transposase family tnp2 [Rhizoctonia solani]